SVSQAGSVLGECVEVGTDNSIADANVIVEQPEGRIVERNDLAIGVRHVPPVTQDVFHALQIVFIQFGLECLDLRFAQIGCDLCDKGITGLEPRLAFVRRDGLEFGLELMLDKFPRLVRVWLYYLYGPPESEVRGKLEHALKPL